MAKQGVFYPYNPQASYTQRWQHTPLAAALPGRKLNWLQPGKAKTLDQAYDQMFADFDTSGCNTLLLSSEGFCDINVREEQISWLKDRFAGFDITVIAYIRRQDAYFLSTYQELVKAGHSSPLVFDDFIKADRLYFARRLAPWRMTFGHDKVKVRPFSPALWPENEPFYDFLPLIGASQDGTKLASPQNEGLDYRSVEILRRLNAISDAKGQSQTGLLRLASRSDAHFRRLGGKQKMQLSTEQAEQIRQHFQAENAEALNGSGFSPDVFFPPVAKGQQERLQPQKLPGKLLLNLLWQQAPDAAAGHASKAAGKSKQGKSNRKKGTPKAS